MKTTQKRKLSIEKLIRNRIKIIILEISRILKEREKKIYKKLNIVEKMLKAGR